jgi:AcrR family transcriptional regulator
MAKAASGAREEQPATSPRRQLMETEVLQHATRLFAERGFSGTSLQDVAESMGLKRPALYYYFKSKDALLERLIADATLGPAKDLRAIGEQRSLDPAVRVHAMACWIVKFIVANSDLFLLMLKSESDLAPATTKKFNDGRRAALAAVRAVIEEGVESGDFRPVDPEVAAFSVWGLCNWVAFWYKPERSKFTVDWVAGQLADMAVAGLQSAERRETAVMDPRHALRTIREALDSLEERLDPGRSARSEARSAKDR